jgi:beta-1,4-mannooligosaccharide/beta-1,4-mannosyl-N-acetylglucosamine phosphorylase
VNAVRRHPANPILSAADIPYPATLVSKPGVAYIQGRYVMVFRNDVVFPGAMILEDDETVKIYYGAADAVVCLATARVDDLLQLCIPV